MNIQIINPIEYPNWDNLLLANPEASFFHTAAWAEVLSESYNYTPLYFTEIENGKLTALIPVMEIKSILTGKRGISLPFTDYCQPLYKDESQFNRAMHELIEYGKKVNWRYLILRGDIKYYDKPSASEIFITHSLDLSKGEKDVFKTFRDSTCRNIKRAMKESVRITFNNTWNSVEIYYRLHCITRKKHGLPPQPKLFFRKFFKHIVSRNNGFIALATRNGIPVAGAIFVHFGKNAIFKYGASDPKYHHLRPNNLLMWETIKHYLQKGYRYFSFGKTELENIGLLQFKRGWGTKEEKLNYYKYDLKNNCFVSGKKGLRTSYDFFRHMPSPLLRLTGSILYRHVG